MRETLKEALSAMEITLPEARIDTLCTFAQRVIAQNEVMNLTAITEYEEVMNPLIAKYNEVKRNGKSGSRWNGFMLLPIITGLITFASTKLMKQTQPPQPPTANGSGKDMQNAMQANMKMMQWFMPIMLAVFALLYSTAFTVYMVISNLFSTVFQLIYNACVKVNDKRNEEKRLESTFK